MTYESRPTLNYQRLPLSLKESVSKACTWKLKAPKHNATRVCGQTCFEHVVAYGAYARIIRDLAAILKVAKPLILHLTVSRYYNNAKSRTALRVYRSMEDIQVHAPSPCFNFMNWPTLPVKTSQSLLPAQALAATATAAGAAFTMMAAPKAPTRVVPLHCFVAFVLVRG